MTYILGEPVGRNAGRFSFARRCPAAVPKTNKDRRADLYALNHVRMTDMARAAGMAELMNIANIANIANMAPDGCSGVIFSGAPA